TDRYGRTIALCTLADGSDLNAWMVRQGFAVASGYGGTYAAEQAEAKAARRGIWEGTVISPANWRREKSEHPHQRSGQWTFCACPCRRTGDHFAGTCARVARPQWSGATPAGGSRPA